MGTVAGVPWAQVAGVCGRHALRIRPRPCASCTPGSERRSDGESPGQCCGAQALRPEAPPQISANCARPASPVGPSFSSGRCKPVCAACVARPPPGRVVPHRENAAARRRWQLQPISTAPSRLGLRSARHIADTPGVSLGCRRVVSHRMQHAPASLARQCRENTPATPKIRDAGAESSIFVFTPWVQRP
jgi:hypothetical protein